MSYDDNYNQGGGGGGGYGGQQEEYGGGGRGGDNYYQQGQQGGNYGRQGGEEYNRPGGQGNPSHDLSGAMQHAQQHSGSSGDEGMFGHALGFLQQNMGGMQQNPDIDEGQAVQAHQALYGGGGQAQGQQQHTSQTLGMGAAMQALKMFSGGQGTGGGGQGSQNQFIGLAMAQASKLFDEQSGQGNVSSGASKQSAITSAGEMAMKMYMKSQMGGGGSGMSGLMGMASKFL